MSVIFLQMLNMRLIYTNRERRGELYNKEQNLIKEMVLWSYMLL